MFGPIRVPVYEVPIAVHYQWCQWCSEQFDLKRTVGPQPIDKEPALKGPVDEISD